MNTKQYMSLKQLCRFFLALLVFSVVFDPGNIHFGIKNYSFLLFCALSIPFFNGKYFYVPLFCLTLYFISFAHGTLIQEQLDAGIALWNLTSFMFLIVLVFICDFQLKFFRIVYYVSLMLCAYTLFLAVTVIPVFPISQNVISHITNNEDFIMYGIRRIYGLPHFCLYYRTCSICIIPEACSLLLFKETKKRKYLFHFFLFFMELFISGARANMIAGIFILLIYLLSCIFYVKKNILLFVTTAIVTLITVFLVFLFLVSEKENSNLIKIGHYSSFMELFDSAPIRYLLIGSGPGTIMYSKGFGRFTALTELSYFEFIKNFGLLPSVFMVLLFLMPLFFIWTSKGFFVNGMVFKNTLSAAYFVFFFVAATNPLFVGSTGFTSIISMFYLCDKNVVNEFETSSSSIKFSPLCKYLRCSI